MTKKLDKIDGQIFELVGQLLELVESREGAEFPWGEGYLPMTKDPITYLEGYLQQYRERKHYNATRAKPKTFCRQVVELPPKELHKFVVGEVKGKGWYLDSYGNWHKRKPPKPSYPVPTIPETPPPIVRRDPYSHVKPDLRYRVTAVKPFNSGVISHPDLFLPWDKGVEQVIPGAVLRRCLQSGFEYDEAKLEVVISKGKKVKNG